MNFNLVDRTVLLTVAGSRAYGISTVDSDIDVKGVCVPTKECYLGYLNSFEQADKPCHIDTLKSFLTVNEQEIANRTKLEGSIYELKKFFKLAADCNPNILDLLFCRDEDVRICTPVGLKLRENRNLFLSKKCRFTFGGYAFSQLKRIQTHRKYLLNPPTHAPTREEFNLPERYLIPREQLLTAQDGIKKQIDSWEIDFGQMDESSKIYVQDQMAFNLAELKIASDDKFAAAARIIGYDENFIYLLQKERGYGMASLQWKQYNNWKKERNPERAKLEKESGFDRKHAIHLIRLLKMGKEILETGKVNVWRDDADELLSIRNGAWTYEQVVEFAEENIKILDELYKTSTVVPKTPNHVALDKLCMELVGEMI
jgi:hypothetical protein